MGTAKFDGYANQYDAWFMANENVFNSELKLVVKALGDLTGKKVLSVGCGSGLFESNFAYKNVEGLEPSKDMAEIAQKRGLNVTIGTIEATELQSDSYDVIYFNGSSSYIEDLTAAYQKAYAALKSGGKLVLFDVPKESAYGLMYLLALCTGSYEHKYLEGTMPDLPYPIELVKSACWHTSEEKITVLKELGMKNFSYYQTLVNHPVYTNDEVEEVIPGYQAGGYVAIIAEK